MDRSTIALRVDSRNVSTHSVWDFIGIHEGVIVCSCSSRGGSGVGGHTIAT